MGCKLQQRKFFKVDQCLTFLKNWVEAETENIQEKEKLWSDFSPSSTQIPRGSNPVKVVLVFWLFCLQNYWVFCDWNNKKRTGGVLPEYEEVILEIKMTKKTLDFPEPSNFYFFRSLQKTLYFWIHFSKNIINNLNQL